MNIFNIKERKEVGPRGGTTSGDSLFTTEELDRILGPIKPGLHEGDEVRFSARISNQLSCPVVNLKIADRSGKIFCELDTVAAGSKECVLDIRQKVTSDYVSAGYASFDFELTGTIRNSKGAEISVFTKIVNLEIPVN
jgi:hypothetical protein